MKKLLITIAILSAASLCGCANSGESAVSSESSVPTTSAAAAQSTSAATAATTASTTATTTTAAETTASEAVEEITENADNSEPVVIEENTDPKPAKPEAETTPDGKYTLAETDLINEDGTYTQDLSSADTISSPDFLTEVNTAWSSDNSRFEDGGYSGKKSNPSKIPYSEITLENAAEAFPYMGFTGKHPGYIEILPTDDTNIIAMKVWNNLVGNEAINTGMNYEGYGFAYMPEHIFSSESEYNAYVAQQEAERAAADAADAKAREDSEAGRFGFDNEDVTQEDIDSTLALFESLGL